MKLFSGKSLQAVLTLAFAAWLLYYLNEHRGAFRSLADISAFHVVALVCCVMASWIVNSIQGLILLRMEKVPVGFWENLLVQTASVLGNFLPMRAGTILRYAYFKRRYGLEYFRLGGITALRMVLLTIATGGVGCVALAGLEASGQPVGGLLWPIFGAMLILPAISWWLPGLEKFLPRNNVGEAGRKFMASFATIRSQPVLVLSLLAIPMVAQFALLALRLYISFDVLHLRISPWGLLLLAPVTTLISFLAVTPENMGLREAIIGLLSLAIGYQFNMGVFASAFDMAILIACTVVLGWPATAWTWANMQKPPSPHSSARRIIFRLNCAIERKED